MNQTIRDILDRHSIRAYTNAPVPADALDAILEVGAAAAHGLGFRSRRFTVVTNTQALTSINVALRDAFRLMSPNDEMPSVLKNLIEKAAQDDADFLYGAPVFILVSVNADSMSGAVDTALSIANMSIAAQSLGLGSCWMNQITMLSQAPSVQNALRELGIPEDEMVHGTLVIGTPAPSARFATRIAGQFVYVK
jgi:nitroreductase